MGFKVIKDIIGFIILISFILTLWDLKIVLIGGIVIVFMFYLNVVGFKDLNNAFASITGGGFILTLWDLKVNMLGQIEPIPFVLS